MYVSLKRTTDRVSKFSYEKRAHFRAKCLKKRSVVAKRLLLYSKTLFGCRTGVFYSSLGSNSCLAAERLLSISCSKWKAMAKLLFGRRTAAVSKNICFGCGTATI